MFDEGVVEEVKREVEALLGERYPEVLKATEEMVFGKREAWGKMKEYAAKEMEAGRGNPFDKALAGGKVSTA